MLLIEEHYQRILRGDPDLEATALFAKQYYSGAPMLADCSASPECRPRS